MTYQQFKAAIQSFKPVARRQFDGFNSQNDCYSAAFSKLTIFYNEDQETPWEIKTSKFAVNGKTLKEAWEVYKA